MLLFGGLGLSASQAPVILATKRFYASGFWAPTFIDTQFLKILVKVGMV